MLSEKNKEDCISIMTSVLLRQKSDTFHKISLLVMKNRPFMTMFNAKGSGLARMNLTAYPYNRASKTSHSAYMVGLPNYYSFWVFTLQSDTQCRLIHSIAATCAWKSKKIREMRFCDNAKSYSARITEDKILDLGWSVLHHPSYSLNFAPSDFHFLFIKKMLWTTKYNLKISWKHMWKISGQNHLNFTQKESKSYMINGKRWFKIMANILLIEIHC